MTTETVNLRNIVTRSWTKIAPQLIAFLAAGVPATAIIAILSAVGVHIPMTLAVILAGGVSSIAAYIKRDHLLGLDAKRLTGKLAAFILSGLSSATVIAILVALHITIPPAAAAALPVVVGLIAGFFKADTTVTPTPPIAGSD